MAVQLFLSCVSDEFGGYRAPLSNDLTVPDVAVKIQEEFKPQGGDTLGMLEAYLAPCAAVVHFIGDMTGASPPDFCLRELLKRHPNIKTKLPRLPPEEQLAAVSPDEAFDRARAMHGRAAGDVGGDADVERSIALAMIKRRGVSCTARIVRRATALYGHWIAASLRPSR